MREFSYLLIIIFVGLGSFSAIGAQASATPVCDSAGTYGVRVDFDWQSCPETGDFSLCIADTPGPCQLFVYTGWNKYYSIYSLLQNRLYLWSVYNYQTNSFSSVGSFSTPICTPCSATASVSPPGSGTASISGGTYFCGDGGTSQASAVPNQGYGFDGWDVNGDSIIDYLGNNNPLNLSHDTNWIIKALFSWINRSPSVVNPSLEEPDYRISGPAAIVSWNFSDPDTNDYQSAYQIQIANGPNFSGGHHEIIFDSNKIPSDSTSYAVGPGNLFYKETYYWRIRVWDSYDSVSDWAPSTPVSFSTPKHQYPSVINLSWVPVNPSVNEEANFSATTKCYAVGGGETPCPTSKFTWTFDNGTPSTVSGEASPRVKFSTSGLSNVTLSIMDDDNYPAERTETISCRLPLPGWKETAPQ